MGPPEHKGYFLFKGGQAEEVKRHDFAKIRRSINKRLYEHQGKKLKQMILSQT